MVLNNFLLLILRKQCLCDVLDGVATLHAFFLILLIGDDFELFVIGLFELADFLLEFVHLPNIDVLA
jgi:hypothetical protein